MGDHFQKRPDAPPLDFSWPYRVAEFLAEWLRDRWHDLCWWFGIGLARFPLVRRVLSGLMWSCLAYIGLILICVSYVYFPVSPYGLWDILAWVATVAIVTFVSVYTLYAGGYLFLSLCLLLFSIGVYFTLSLSFICWALARAARHHSEWLRRCRTALVTGLLASLVLATFVEGSDRFWDGPFDIRNWTKLFLLSISAWATLFCGLVRDRANDPAALRRAVTWTLVLAIGFGLLAFWSTSGQKAEYLLHRNVVEHPKDAGVWLDLASHYHDEGDRLAAEPGDEDHSPPDPTPSYKRALQYLNRAVSLGAGGFDVNFERAQLANEVGEREEAISFGKLALGQVPPSIDASSPEMPDRVQWLRGMIARNSAALPAMQEHQSVRRQRRESLPQSVRWVFDLIQVFQE